MELKSLLGLPAHPLVVHGAIVLVPLVAVGTIIVACWRQGPRAVRLGRRRAVHRRLRLRRAGARRAASALADHVTPDAADPRARGHGRGRAARGPSSSWAWPASVMALHWYLGRTVGGAAVVGPAACRWPSPAWPSWPPWEARCRCTASATAGPGPPGAGRTWTAPAPAAVRGADDRPSSIATVSTSSRLDRPRWTNWAGNQSCSPERDRAAPIRGRARRASSSGRRPRAVAVKVVGAGHSFTPIVCTDGYLLDLGDYDRVLPVDSGRGHRDRRRPASRCGS